MPSVPQADALDERLAAYAADIVALDAQLAERDARIADVQADNTIWRERVAAAGYRGMVHAARGLRR